MESCFKDKCQATLDDPDSFCRCWVATKGEEPSVRNVRRQCGGGVMFWHFSGICQREFIDPFRVEQGVKINSENYCKFLKRNFELWVRQRPPNEGRRLVYMQDNAPSHAARHVIFYVYRFFRIQLMDWPAYSPDWIPIEKMFVYHKMQSIRAKMTSGAPSSRRMLKFPQKLSQN